MLLLICGAGSFRVEGERSLRRRKCSVFYASDFSGLATGGLLEGIGLRGQLLSSMWCFRCNRLVGSFETFQFHVRGSRSALVRWRFGTDSFDFLVPFNVLYEYFGECNLYTD